MSNRTTHMVVAALTVACLAAGLLLAPRLPATVVSHWNFQGEPDGTMPRQTLLATFPALIAGLYILIVVLIGILPLRENVAAFRPHLNLFLAAMSVFPGLCGGLVSRLERWRAVQFQRRDPAADGSLVLPARGHPGPRQAELAVRDPDALDPVQRQRVGSNPPVWQPGCSRRAEF